MFCCGSKSAVSDPLRDDSEWAARRKAQREDARAQGIAPPAGRSRRPDWGTGAGGQRLGGGAAEEPSSQADDRERRLRALEAAERRQATAPGVAPKVVAELAQRQQRENLLGRLTEQYRRLGEDMPMGLNSEKASVDQLKRHLEMLRGRV
ncbi:unnamed protein product [Polarella glacialis]|uniref:Uncharacterized protein n=1 Tax=Polarella glacialis TaxID=89957 RepID=A0A813FTZ8_POLGL|nr:unnamed protein product [Polarella glacialis]|mmetsp:Transcript_53341/g.86273  ORF Transcript_53341/g.86273 Transcript_53341/m.86273 type:complete len:150 (-) Transcript_53341:104-553(-)|eukprot:CAMPEP_0115143962 /NCGR_PEP_ID=MMETSP0227-20121206/61109_1 /TAXON_ID=89957 /ORGANISM="Polarella glacialis, Strain CCMP 1383" /LENGTH=149 /DNA_ID=CAMNT_0002552943 /DNA_START=107 /DNA_END=556 /DNA_ORIENTATION=-